jgi:regulator of protease activity HflC (stomatin/prohibitin superfamily)
MKYIHTITVRETQAALLFRNGVFERMLAPGKQRFFGFGYEVRIHDTRWKEMQIQGQEFLTADKAQLRASAFVKYRITDALLFESVSDNPAYAIYTAAQLALRDAIGALGVEDALDRGKDLSPDLTAKVVAEAAALGVEVAKVAVKDMGVGGDLKKVFADVLSARSQSLVTLEKARAEAAAIRTLSNAARVFETNPALLKLKFLQALEKSEGAYAQPYMLGNAGNWLDFLKT